jgi:hypothetical protein
MESIKEIWLISSRRNQPDIMKLRNVSGEFVEKLEIHIMFSEPSGFYKMTWKNIVQPERPQITI